MPSPSLSEKFSRLPGNLKGALILLVAAFGFSVMVLLIKLLGERLHVAQILLARQLVLTLIVAPAIFKDFPGCLNSKNTSLQFVRVFFAVSAMYLGFIAVIELPLGDATALAFAKSFFVTIFAVIVLKETVGLRRWGAVAAGFVGVFIMMQPGTTGFSIFGIFAVVSAAAAGVVMVLIRYMSRTDSPTTILAYQALGVGAIMVIPGIYFWQAPTPYEWLLLILMGTISYFAQMANIYAYKFGEASVLASLDYVRLLYSVFFGYLVFETLPSGAVWLGAGIVVAASVYTLQREARRKQKITRSPVGRGHQDIDLPQK